MPIKNFFSSSVKNKLLAKIYVNRRHIVVIIVCDATSDANKSMYKIAE